MIYTLVLLALAIIFIPIGIWQSQVRKRRMQEQAAEFQRLAGGAAPLIQPPPAPPGATPADATAELPGPEAASPAPVPATEGGAPDPTAQYRTATPDPTNGGKTPHKFQWNGLDATTTLTEEGVRFAVQNALLAFRGGLSLDTSDPHRYIGEIRSWAGVRQLTFDLEISEAANGWRAVRTTMLHWVTSQPTVLVFIPVGPKQMLGHKTYMDFVQMVATNLRTADPAAAIVVRSGPMPPGFDLAALNRTLQPPTGSAPAAPAPPRAVPAASVAALPAAAAPPDAIPAPTPPASAPPTPPPPVDAARAEVLDPSVEPARLAELAHERPDLAEEIAQHPNVYPELLAWLSEHGATASEPAVALGTPASGGGIVARVTGDPHALALAAATALVLVIGLVVTPIVGIASSAASASSDYYDGDSDIDDGYSDDGSGTAATIGCPDGSTPVMWSDWEGGATIVCRYSGGDYVMIVANGGSVDDSADVTVTRAGYSSPLGEIALGGWAFWLPGSDSSEVAQSWGSSDWGRVDGGAGPNQAIPACPSGTFAVSLSIWEGGLLLTCGLTDGSVTAFRYADGSQSGFGGPMSSSGGRYCGTDDLGREVCVSAAPALVQIADGRYSVGTNFFPEAGPGGAGQGTGAYGVDAPAETDVDQVGYLVAILEKSGEARAQVNAVLAPLNACSVGEADIAALQALTQARTDLLAALRTTPVDRIPGGGSLLAQLTEAIQLSEEADVYYVQTAQQMAAGDCSGGRSIYSTAIAVANSAEVSKQMFVDMWNAQIAGAYGVRTFTAKDI